eukprot:1137576-Pelagomonas_calceolata.AAC.1
MMGKIQVHVFRHCIRVNGMCISDRKYAPLMKRTNETDGFIPELVNTICVAGTVKQAEQPNNLAKAKESCVLTDGFSLAHPVISVSEGECIASPNYAHLTNYSRRKAVSHDMHILHRGPHV